jgi:hypothetical protein
MKQFITSPVQVADCTFDAETSTSDTLVYSITLTVYGNSRTAELCIDARTAIHCPHFVEEMVDRALDRLEQAAAAGPEDHRNKLGSLIKQLKEIEMELAQGKRIPRTRLDRIQIELDTLL